MKLSLPLQLGLQPGICRLYARRTTHFIGTTTHTALGGRQVDEIFCAIDLVPLFEILKLLFQMRTNRHSLCSTKSSKLFIS